MPKPVVSYFYDQTIGDYEYSSGHPMKPFRVKMTHSLVMHYDLHKKMDIFRPHPASALEMTQFHTDDYIEFLRKVTPENVGHYPGMHNIGVDSPVFHGIYDFSSLSAGGSIEGAARLNLKKSDIAINWAGGLHHAKKDQASGFCYVNDIVLAILELLRFHKRVLYIDIDVHHGDGVEEAFYTTDRVMCLSLHRHGAFFPGTGDLMDIGHAKGKYHSVNIPLQDGMDDESYKTIFNPVLDAIMQYYRPEAVVLQCGADSLSGDRLGPFNLSMSGHAHCISYVQSKVLPTLVLGGGGYTIKNVARTWAKETGNLLKTEMDPIIPMNEYYNYFGPDFELDVKASNMSNKNSKHDLDRILETVTEHLRSITFAPSIQLMDIPTGLYGDHEEKESRLDDEDEDANPDVRITKRKADSRIEHDLEFMENDDELDSLESMYSITPRVKRQKGSSERNRTDGDREHSVETTEGKDCSSSPTVEKTDGARETSVVEKPNLDATEGKRKDSEESILVISDSAGIQ